MPRWPNSKKNKAAAAGAANIPKGPPGNHPQEHQVEHRQFLIRSLQRNDVELAALHDLNRSLRQAKSQILNACGERVLLQLGTGELRLVNDELVNHSTTSTTTSTTTTTSSTSIALSPTQQSYCIDFLLRLKLRRQLGNRLMRRLHRLATAMDGTDVAPPPPPKYGDLPLNVNDANQMNAFIELKQQQDAMKERVLQGSVLDKLAGAAGAVAAAVSDDEAAGDASNKDQDPKPEATASSPTKIVVPNENEQGATETDETEKEAAAEEEEKANVEEATKEKEEQSFPADGAKKDETSSSSPPPTKDETAEQTAAETADDSKKNEDAETETSPKEKDAAAASESEEKSSSTEPKEASSASSKEDEPKDVEMKPVEAKQEDVTKEQSTKAAADDNDDKPKKDEKDAAAEASPMDVVKEKDDKEKDQPTQHDKEESSQKSPPEAVASHKTSSSKDDSNKKNAPLTDADWNLLRDYHTLYEKKWDAASQSFVYRHQPLVEQEPPEIAALPYGGGVGATQRHMTQEERALDYKRWQTQLMGRLPEQPTLEELGLKHRVFLYQERHEWCLQQEQDENDDASSSSSSDDEPATKKQKKGDDGSWDSAMLEDDDDGDNTKRREKVLESGDDSSDGSGDDDDEEEDEAQDADQKPKADDNAGTEPKKDGRVKEKNKDNDNDDDSDEEETNKDKVDDNDDDNAKNEKDQELQLPKRIRPMPLVAIPSFYEQDLKRIRIIQGEMLVQSMAQHSHEKLGAVTKEYNRGM